MWLNFASLTSYLVSILVGLQEISSPISQLGPTRFILKPDLATLLFVKFLHLSICHLVEVRVKNSVLQCMHLNQGKKNPKT